MKKKGFACFVFLLSLFVGCTKNSARKIATWSNDIKQEFIVQDADNRLYNYQWFYDQYQQCKATASNVKLFLLLSLSLVLFSASRALSTGPFALETESKTLIQTGSPRTQATLGVCAGSEVTTCLASYPSQGRRQARGVEETRRSWGQSQSLKYTISALLGDSASSLNLTVPFST